ncbi:MAG: 30S ribosomal protein S21 [Anaerolineae bacterium]
MASVKLRSGESQEELLKRFRKKVATARILSTIREKRWFVSRSEKRRKERKRAIRKMRRREMRRRSRRR